MRTITNLAGALGAAALLLPVGAAWAAHHETGHASEKGESAEAMEESREAMEEPHVGMDTADQYVVEPGDTLAQIAQDHLGAKDLWHHIAEANGIDDPRQLAVGQKLTIPKRKAEGLQKP